MTENPYASPTSPDTDDGEAISLGDERSAWWADNERLDRLWLRANVAVWLLGWIVLLPFTMSVVGPIVPAMFSGMLTLFFVAIPSRVVLNLMLRGRRKRYFKETVVRCITFGVLCWVAYLVHHTSNPYP